MHRPVPCGCMKRGVFGGGMPRYPPAAKPGCAAAVGHPPAPGRAPRFSALRVPKRPLRRTQRGTAAAPSNSYPLWANLLKCITPVPAGRPPDIPPAPMAVCTTPASCTYSVPWFHLSSHFPFCLAALLVMLFSQPGNQGFGSSQKFAFGHPNAMLANLTGLGKKPFSRFFSRNCPSVPGWIPIGILAGNQMARVDSYRNPCWGKWYHAGDTTLSAARKSGITRVIPSPHSVRPSSNSDDNVLLPRALLYALIVPT